MRKLLWMVGAIVIVLVSCAQTTKEVQEVSPKEVYEAVYKSNSDLQLVDVRTPEEYGVSHLRDAQNICVTEADFESKVANLDRDKPIYVYCKSGGRSARAAKILHEMGFKEIYDLQGGITAWKSQGLKTVD